MKNFHQNTRTIIVFTNCKEFVYLLRNIFTVSTQFRFRQTKFIQGLL